MAMQMEWKEMLGKADGLFTDAKGILSDMESGAEAIETAEKQMNEAMSLKSRALRLKDIIDAAIDQELLAQAQKVPVVDAAPNAPVQKNLSPPEEYKEWGEWLYSIWAQQTQGVEDTRLRYFRDSEAGGHEEKQMAEAVGATGGFLVPTEFLPQLQALQAENAVVRPRATIIRMARRQIQIPVLNQANTTPTGVPHWFGGMRFYWTAEAEEKTATEPTFKQVTLTAHKLIGYTYASDELLADSAISLGDFLSGPLGFAGGINWMEDYAFLQGTGVGQPQGIIPAPATIHVNRATAGTVTFPDLADMLEKFLPSSRGVWVISQSLMSEIIQLNGPSGNPSYVWVANARDGIPGNILGFPVIWCEKSPLAGVEGDVLLADMRYYLIGDRQATTVRSTQFDRWKYDQTSWRVVHRVDGQPWLSAPLTYQDGTTEVSPFVILDTPTGT